MGSGTRPETKEEEAVLQAYIDSAYSRFVAIVSEGRNKSEEEVKKLLMEGFMMVSKQKK